MSARVLVIGRHPKIMVATLAHLESAGYRTTGRFTDDEAIAAFVETPVDLVIIGGGVEPESKTRLQTQMRERRPDVPVLIHFGGPNGLLDAVEGALAGAPPTEESNRARSSGGAGRRSS